MIVVSWWRSTIVLSWWRSTIVLSWRRGTIVLPWITSWLLIICLMVHSLRKKVKEGRKRVKRNCSVIMFLCSPLLLFVCRTHNAFVI
ncbi:hypothetical protein BD408DRAFT_420082 [Parasitella parasitica]|nr:hypothetical protein BD408DRAFT_420082 [Parasitella parasitica]